MDCAPVAGVRTGTCPIDHVLDWVVFGGGLIGVEISSVGWVNSFIVNPTFPHEYVGLRKACNPTYAANPNNIFPLPNI